MMVWKKMRVIMEREEDRERGQPVGCIGCLWKDGSERRDANWKRRKWKSRTAKWKRRMEDCEAGRNSSKPVRVWLQKEEINNLGCFNLRVRRQRSARGRNLRIRGLVWKKHVVQVLR